jgi:abequosyltransferase
MSSTSLSICIPTYNFGKFIGQTLESIILNLTEGVEVIILDGGSTDDTANIVATKQRGFPQIQYHRQEFRGGIDRDIAKVISLAHGRYCWLFSADDIMMPGAVDKVLDSIRSNCDIYLCEQILCDYEMHPITEYPIFNNIATPEIFDLGNASQRQRYFSNARTSEAFFSFLSGPIFRKDVWERADGIPESFYETC